MHAALLAVAFVLQAPTLGPTISSAADQLAQAEARYRAAIALTPSIGAYHESLALILEREGKIREALDEHRTAVRLDSLSARNRAGLGTILLQLGEADSAIVHLQAAAAIDRGSVEVRKALATALLRQSHGEEALTALREARQLDTTDMEVARLLAQAERAPETTGYHDYSTFADERPSSALLQRILEAAFGAVLTISALVLAAPLAAGVVLLVVQLPRHWRDGTVS